MSEETQVMEQPVETEQQVSQADLADQAFDALFGPEETPQQPQTKQTAPTAENKPQQTQPAVETPKESAKPETKGTQQKLDGIFSTFFKDDGGQQVFDVESANKFFSVKTEYDFKGPKYAEDSGTPPPPPKDPIDELWEEREKYQQTIENGSGIWKKYFAAALEGGYDTKVAMAYADQETNKIVQKEVEKKMLELQKEHWKRAESKTQEQARLNELSAKARINEERLEQLAGGKERYASIMYSPDFGGKVLHWLYATSNPQQQTQSQYRENFSKWVVQFFSSPENADMAYNLSVGLLNNHPHIRKAYNDMIAVQKDKQARDSLKTTSQKPSGMKPATKSLEQSGIASWLSGDIPSV
jgi:hypothetical protein